MALGTGTSVISGLITYCALRLIRGLKNLNIIGMDLVDVSSIYDYLQITALAASYIRIRNVIYTNAILIFKIINRVIMLSDSFDELNYCNL